MTGSPPSFHLNSSNPHASVKTTQIYDRRSDDVTLDEIEKIRFHSPAQEILSATRHADAPSARRGAVSVAAQKRKENSSWRSICMREQPAA